MNTNTNTNVNINQTSPVAHVSEILSDDMTEKDYKAMIRTHIKDYLRENNILISYVRKPGRLTTDTTVILDAEDKFVSVTSKPVYKPTEIVGTVVAIGKDQVGWSRRLPTDRFDRYEGIFQALLKAETKQEPCHSMKAHVESMRARAAKYFKTEQ